jgi:hypothetical protein
VESSADGVVRWWDFCGKGDIRGNEPGWICVTSLVSSDGLSLFKCELSDAGCVIGTLSSCSESIVQVASSLDFSTRSPDTKFVLSVYGLFCLYLQMCYHG